MVAPSMRAVGVNEFGGPDALEVVELPEPHPGPGQVRIRVHAATVNPTDTLLRSGGHGAPPDQQPPYIPGMDVAGVVDEVGAGAPWSVGDEVMAMTLPRSPLRGGYAEQVVVPADSVARAPAGAGHVAASTLPMNGLTARQALDLLALRPGQTLAVTGGAGATGGYAIQLAKTEGLRVVADAAPADEELIHTLGADVVVPRGAGVADRIREAVPEGVDAVLDAALIGKPILAAVRDGGALAAVRPFRDDTERGIAIHGVMVVEYAHEQAKLDRLRQLVEDGALTLRVARTFTPEQAPQAHRALEAGGVRGRLVITFP
jgi:NADPH2:quinone reductase